MAFPSSSGGKNHYLLLKLLLHLHVKQTYPGTERGFTWSLFSYCSYAGGIFADAASCHVQASLGLGVVALFWGVPPLVAVCLARVVIQAHWIMHNCLLHILVAWTESMHVDPHCQRLILGICCHGIEWFWLRFVCWTLMCYLKVSLGNVVLFVGLFTLLLIECAR